MRFFALMTTLALLTACGPTTESVGQTNGPPPGAAPPEDSEGGSSLADIELCDAKSYRPLVGSPVSATTFPTGSKLRVFGFDDIVTQDYIPQRTNVVYDGQGNITRVYCG